MFIADHCIFAPIVQALSVLKFPIKSIQQVQKERPDYSVMRTCLIQNAILITLDLGIPSQAYAFQYAKAGLTVILLRWRTQTPKDWQQMTEVILRDHEQWSAIAKKDTSVISVSYKGGSRPRSWSQISPLIVEHAFVKEKAPLPNNQ